MINQVFSFVDTPFHVIDTWLILPSCSTNGIEGFLTACENSKINYFCRSKT